MSKTNISTLIDILTVARNEYKRNYGQVKKTYDKEIKEIQRDFKPNTPRYIEEMQKAKQRFESQVEEQRKTVKEFTLHNIDDMVDDEVAVVRRIDTVAMEKLSAVANLPLTATEISILQERFAPNGEYWATRMIGDLAEKNGLKPSQFLHSATLDTKLDVLKQLKQQLETFLTDYDGEPRYQTEVLLADAVLARAERIYTNGYMNTSMEDEQIARRAFVQLKGKSVAEQGIGLQNILNNTTEATKRALFFEIANNVSGINIDDGALRWAGYADEFEAYKKNEHSDYKEARKAFDKVITAGSKEEVESVAVRMGENKYFNNMLQDAKNTSKYVESYLHDTSEAETSTKTAEE